MIYTFLHIRSNHNDFTNLSWGLSVSPSRLGVTRSYPWGPPTTSLCSQSTLRAQALPYRVKSPSSVLGLEIPSIPELSPSSGLEIPTISTLEIPTLESSTPQKLYIKPSAISVPWCFSPGQRQAPSCVFPIHLFCEVCCAVGLCDIPWLLTARIFFCLRVVKFTLRWLHGVIINNPSSLSEIY